MIDLDMKTQLEHNAQTFPIDLTPTGKTYRVTLGEKTATVEVLSSQNGQLHLLVDGRPVRASVSSNGTKRWVTFNGQTFLLTKSNGARKGGGHAHHTAGELLAPMPGLVRAVQAAEGESVTKGQTLIIVEAMKMELKVSAPFDGIIQSVHVKIGQMVEREQLLAVVMLQESK